MLKNFYGQMRKKMGPKSAGILGKIAFAVGNKPSVKRDTIPKAMKFPGGEEGGMIISADFELSWAFRFSKRTRDYIKIGRYERENVPKIIALLEEYNIPITWATVGHLLLERCQKGEHDWMRRIPYFDDHWRFTEGDWFGHDPYSNMEDDGEWYAADLIKKILTSPVNHEIGCHTFSHIDCTYKNCPKEVLDDELKACTLAAKKYGLTLSSFVFPGGTFGNYEILKKHQYKIYRKRTEADLSYPFRDNFGILISSSSSSFGDNGLSWGREYFIMRHKKYIDKAIQTNTVTHFWFHPSIDQWTLHEVMPEVFQYATDLRRQGKLWMGTMGQIAAHINQSNLA